MRSIYIYCLNDYRYYIIAIYAIYNIYKLRTINYLSCLLFIYNSTALLNSFQELKKEHFLICNT